MYSKEKDLILIFLLLILFPAIKNQASPLGDQTKESVKKPEPHDHFFDEKDNKPKSHKINDNDKEKRINELKKMTKDIIRKNNDSKKKLQKYHFYYFIMVIINVIFAFIIIFYFSFQMYFFFYFKKKQAIDIKVSIEGNYNNSGVKEEVSQSGMNESCSKTEEINDKIEIVRNNLSDGCDEAPVVNIFN